MPDFAIIEDVASMFSVSRPMALLIIIMCVSTALGTLSRIYMMVRVGFHAMHFDVLKKDVERAKDDADRSAERAHKALLLSYDIIKSSLPKLLDDAPDGESDP